MEGQALSHQYECLPTLGFQSESVITTILQKQTQNSPRLLTSVMRYISLTRGGMDNDLSMRLSFLSQPFHVS